MIKILCYSLILFALCPLIGQSQDINFTASVDRTTMSPGEEFAYTIRISSDSVKGLPEPKFPSFADFEILSGPNTSQSFQFINGSMSREIVYTTILRSKRTGEFTIEPALIRAGNKEMKSESIKINVTQTPSQNLPSPLKDENIPSPSTSNEDLKKQLEGNLFFRTEISNKTPYVGEPVVLSYTLYALKGLPLSSVSPTDQVPQYGSFLKEDLYTAQRLSFREVKIDDKIYQAALIKQIILVPTKSGKTTPDPLSLQIVIRAPRQQTRSSRHPFFDDPFFNDSFPDPFGRDMERVLVQSPLTEMDVQPLPAPRPEDFTGTVGDYTISSSVDRRKATMDDLITLSLSLNGTGAVEGVLEPRLPALDGFELYETKAKADKKIVANTLGGSKTFDYVLRPQKSGDLEIPGISYAIFDPKKKSYVNLKTDPIRIAIDAGTARAPLIISGPSPASSSEGELVEINADINYIKRDLRTLHMRRSPLLEAGWFLGLQALPILFVLGSFYFMRRRYVLESDVGLARRLRARGVAGRRLKAASIALSRNNSDAFYTELASALRGYFGDKLNREPHGLTIEELSIMLKDRGIEDEWIKNICDLLETADAVRYTPVSHTPEEMRNHYDQASKIIQEFSKKL
jgi:hypothetical protein